MVAFMDDPTEIKTLALATDVHSEFQIWTKEHEVSSVFIPEMRSREADSENRSATGTEDTDAARSTVQEVPSDQQQTAETDAAIQSVAAAIVADIIEYVVVKS